MATAALVIGQESASYVRSPMRPDATEGMRSSARHAAVHESLHGTERTCRSSRCMSVVEG